jgi:hypothetical protein
MWRGIICAHHLGYVGGKRACGNVPYVDENYADTRCSRTGWRKRKKQLRSRRQPDPGLVWTTKGCLHCCDAYSALHVSTNVCPTTRCSFVRSTKIDVSPSCVVASSCCLSAMSHSPHKSTALSRTTEFSHVNMKRRLSRQMYIQRSQPAWIGWTDEEDKLSARSVGLPLLTPYAHRYAFYMLLTITALTTSLCELYSVS